MFVGICGKLNANSLCKKCEILLDRQAEFTILENNNIENYFNSHMYIFKYENNIRKLILNYKFNNKSYLYRTIANFIIKNEKFCKNIKSYDIIIPVPISKKRSKERGYNQSYLIAKELSQKLNIELVNNCLVKSKNIIEQSKLNKEERIKNIQGVYTLINPMKIEGQKILLIDDIFTTGSTVNECCKTLHKTNIKEVSVLTIAKD